MSFLKEKSRRLKGKVPRRPWIVKIEHMHGDADGTTFTTSAYPDELTAVVVFLMAVVLRNYTEPTGATLHMQAFQEACVLKKLPTIWNNKMVSFTSRDYPTIQQVEAGDLALSAVPEDLFDTSVVNPEENATISMVTLSCETRDAVIQYQEPLEFVKVYERLKKRMSK